jgi:hypothetical protein
VPIVRIGARPAARPSVLTEERREILLQPFMPCAHESDCRLDEAPRLPADRGHSRTLAHAKNQAASRHEHQPLALTIDAVENAGVEAFAMDDKKSDMVTLERLAPFEPHDEKASSRLEAEARKAAFEGTPV